MRKMQIMNSVAAHHYIDIVLKITLSKHDTLNLFIHYFYAHDILGIVYFDFVDYKVTGYHDITIEAVNHVTGSTVSDTGTVDVLYMIGNPEIDITTPTWDDFLVHPGDVIRFDVSVDFASRVDVRLLCSDGQNVSITFLLCDLYPRCYFFD